MDRIRIRGGRPLSGSIPIGGAKNAALPLMAACLLTDEPLVLTRLPRLADITTLAHLLVQHGVSITMRGAEREDEVPGHVLALDGAAHRLDHRALRSRAQDARLGAGAGAARRAAAARRGCRCPAAAPSARGRSICI